MKYQDLQTEFARAKSAVQTETGAIRILIMCETPGGDRAPGGNAKAQILLDGEVDVISVVGFSAESRGEYIHTVDEHQLGPCHSVEMLDNAMFTFSTLAVAEVIVIDHDINPEDIRPRLQEQS